MQFQTKIMTKDAPVMQYKFQ